MSRKRHSQQIGYKTCPVIASPTFTFLFHPGCKHVPTSTPAFSTGERKGILWTRKLLVVSADLKSANKLHIWLFAVRDSVRFSFCSGIKNAGSGHSCDLQTKKKIAGEKTQTQAEKESCSYLSGRILSGTRACLLSGWLLRLLLAAYLVIFPYVLTLKWDRVRSKSLESAHWRAPFRAPGEQPHSVLHYKSQIRTKEVLWGSPVCIQPRSFPCCLYLLQVICVLKRRQSKVVKNMRINPSSPFTTYVLSSNFLDILCLNFPTLESSGDSISVGH